MEPANQTQPQKSQRVKHLQKPVVEAILQSPSSPTKKYTVKGFWLASGISWPGHFSGTTSLKEGPDVKDMHLSTLDGWIVFKHKGVLGATNGVATVELEEVE